MGFNTDKIYTYNKGMEIKNNIKNRHSVEMNEIDFNRDVEVIGNIYENHEMIEQQ